MFKLIDSKSVVNTDDWTGVTATPCGCPSNTGGSVDHLPQCPLNPLNKESHKQWTEQAPLQGWICPNCGMSNSHFTSQCCRKPPVVVTFSGSGGGSLI
jgi:hypothetical protein